MHQAAPTPMGHGEGYSLFHSQDQHDTARKVLEERLEWKHPMDEVNKYIDNLRRSFDKDKLQEEVKVINSVVTAGEFRNYFKTKTESTESSPSGRHIGHYKAILRHDDLVEMMVAMLNIGLVTGTALHRWQHTISVMLEKDKGSPKLN